MSRSDDRIGCRRRSREKSHNVSSFHGRKEDGRRISRPFSYPYRHSTVDLPLSSSCRRSSEYPKEQYSLTQEYDHLHHRHHQWKRQRLHSPNHVSGMRKKHKLNVNEAHCSSHLSAAECTLEIRESVSGVRSIDGSEVRHKSVKSAGDSGYGRREGGCRIERRHDKSRCDNGGHGLSGRREGEYCKECRHDGSRHYEVRHNHSGGGCGRREGGRDRECRHGSEHGGGGGGRREGGCDGIVDVDRYTASLSEPYYLTGEDKVMMNQDICPHLYSPYHSLFPRPGCACMRACIRDCGSSLYIGLTPCFKMADGKPTKIEHTTKPIYLKLTSAAS